LDIYKSLSTKTPDLKKYVFTDLNREFTHKKNSKNNHEKMNSLAMQAVKLNQADWLQDFLKTIPDINSILIGLRPLLYYAVKYNAIDCVKLLLEKGANPCWFAQNAAENNQLEILKLLYDAIMLDTINFPHKLFLTLQSAIEKGHLNIVEYLIDRNKQENPHFNINQFNTEYPLLLLGIEANDLLIVNYLLLNKADLQVRTTEGLSPLNLAAQLGHISIVTLLEEYYAENNLNVIEPSNTGDTALIYAIKQGHRNTCQLLLTLHDDIMEEFEASCTKLLYLAVEHGHFEVLEVLYEAYPESQKTPELYLSLLNIAVHVDNERIVTWACIKLNAIKQFHLVDKSYLLQIPALHKTAANNQLSNAKTLIQYGANVDGSPFPYDSPLHFALNKGHLEMMRLLLDSQANILLPNRDGRTTLHIIAAQTDDFELGFNLIQLCIAHGANPSALTKSNQKATDLAVNSQIKDLLSKLQVIAFSFSNIKPAPTLPPLNTKHIISQLETHIEAAPENTSSIFMFHPKKNASRLRIELCLNLLKECPGYFEQLLILFSALHHDLHDNLYQLILKELKFTHLLEAKNFLYCHLLDQLDYNPALEIMLNQELLPPFINLLNTKNRLIPLEFKSEMICLQYVAKQVNLSAPKINEELQDQADSLPSNDFSPRISYV
jgi:ankyrin repeat protein